MRSAGTSSTDAGLRPPGRPRTSTQARRAAGSSGTGARGEKRRPGSRGREEYAARSDSTCGYRWCRSASMPACVRSSRASSGGSPGVPRVESISRDQDRSVNRTQALSSPGRAEVVGGASPSESYAWSTAAVARCRDRPTPPRAVSSSSASWRSAAATASRCGRSGWTRRPSRASAHAISDPAAARAARGSTSPGVVVALADTAKENSSRIAPSPPSPVASHTYLHTPATSAVAATTTAAPAALDHGCAAEASAEPRPTHAVMASATHPSTRARRR
ncbi:hypothetical protein ACGFYT_16155 [Streptomyces sp. NPDC048208]|uniref:hypothetical protein n=1 Tax=Streptomyces sp. NPDC048208 TaxID=3365515 RepID=UPI00371B074E